MINVFGSCVGEEELYNVNTSIHKQWMGAGSFVSKFELEFSDLKATQNFLMVDNATNGLFLACSLLDLPKGAEIIIPSFTCIACAQAIVLAGYTPVFCDVDRFSQNITAECIKHHISSRTGAIMIVHYAGLPVEMNKILELGYIVIEDCAHAVVSEYNGQMCGTIGDIGVFSFDPVKNLATCEGGGIIFKNHKLYEKAKRMRLCGVGNPSHQKSESSRSNVWWVDDAEENFIKTYPNDISAGIALAQLNKLDRLQFRRKQIWEYYNACLSSLDDVKLPIDAPEHSKHSYFTYCIQARNRDQLAFYLYENDIYTTMRFYPLHLNKLFRTDLHLPNCEYLAKMALNIPLHPNLSDSEIEYVVGKIIKFYK